MTICFGSSFVVKILIVDFNCNLKLFIATCNVIICKMTLLITNVVIITFSIILSVTGNKEHSTNIDKSYYIQFSYV